MVRRIETRISLVLVITFAYLLTQATASAQVATAAIVGTVTDPSGSIVPGAQVTITNVGTGISQSDTTSPAGDYAFNLLQLGTYSVKVQARGFKAFLAKDITLSPGSRVRVDAKLAIGEQTQTVQVSATDAPLLQTDTSALGTNLTSAALQNLPIQGRNYINLVTLSAGVTIGLPNSLASGQRPADRRQTASYAADGLSDLANDNLIDGMDNNDRFVGTVGVRPSPESIEQVKVMTNQYTAAVGRSAGAVVDLVTKSGTNNFHGSLYEYFGNDKLNTRSYFASTVPELRYNQFGGSIGGPIIKNKTFFFADFDDFLQNIGLPITATVPTLYEEQNPGNFTDIGGPNVSSSITPLGLALFKLYPAPTPGIAASAGYNYAASPVRTQTAPTFDVRVDQHLSDTNSFFGRYTFNNTTTVTPDDFPVVTVAGASGNQVSVNPGAVSSPNAYPGPALERQQALAIVFTHVARPNLLYQFNAGFMRSIIQSKAVNTGSNAATALGFPCNSTSCINVPGSLTDSGLPSITFPGSSYQGLGDASNIPNYTLDNMFQYAGSLTWSPGAHSIQIGVGVIRRQMDEHQSTNPEGVFNFRQTTYTGNALANLLTGQVTTESRSNYLVQPQFRSWEPSSYIQDDWRALHWLTLNLGLRYDIFTPLTEKHGEFSNFDPSLDLLVSPSLPGTQNSSSTGDIQTDFGDIAPRFGFAASLGHSMVLRGGFGMSYFPDSFGTPLVMRNAPFNFSFNCGQAPQSTTPCTGQYAQPNGGGVLSAGLPTPVYNVALATNPADYSGASWSTIAFNFPSAYVEQFSLGLEKTYAGNRFGLGYVGNLGRQLSVSSPANQPVSNVAPYPIPSLPGVTISELVSGGISRYSAMQATYTHQFAKGLTADAHWVWSHMITNAGVPSETGPPLSCSFDGCPMDNPSNPSHPILVNGWQQYDLGNGAIDERHNVSGTMDWLIPYGSRLTGVAGQALKGWDFNVTAFWQSGLPTTVLNGSAVSGIPGLGSDPPDMIASPALSNRSVQAWFNVAAFQKQTVYTLGNERPFQVFGPPNREINLAFSKNFDLTERFKLQFRAESYNLTNTSDFGLPNATITGYSSSGVATSAGGFGTITNTNPFMNPRQIQFVAKLLF